jgi:hypothetical protein
MLRKDLCFSASYIAVLCPQISDRKSSNDLSFLIINRVEKLTGIALSYTAGNIQHISNQSSGAISPRSLLSPATSPCVHSNLNGRLVRFC